MRTQSLGNIVQIYSYSSLEHQNTDGDATPFIQASGFLTESQSMPAEWCYHPYMMDILLSVRGNPDNANMMGVGLTGR
jgi:hypothetical protein